MAAKRILIVAGEASGDHHAAKLVKDVHKVDSTVKFYGMGGSKMRQAGVDVSIDIKELAVIGVFDVLLQLPKIMRLFKQFKQMLKNNPPDMLLLVDYPGFNIRLAKIAHKMGIKVFYYIAPKLWASRAGRIKAIRKYVDKMAVIFPFEVDYFAKFNYPVSFVGNPLTEVVKPTMTRAVAQQQFGLSADHKTVGLFPGSRAGEIKRLLPVILKAAFLLKQRFHSMQFVMPLASSLTEAELQPYFEPYKLDIKIIADKTYDVMQVCDAAIAVSGTVTLEAALMELPMVIIYKVFPPYFPIHWVTNIPYIGLPNIVAEKRIVKELLQQHAHPRDIALEAAKLLNDQKYRNNMLIELGKVKAKLVAEQQDLVQLVLDSVNDLI